MSPSPPSGPLPTPWPGPLPCPGPLLPKRPFKSFRPMGVGRSILMTRFLRIRGNPPSRGRKALTLPGS
ncbi:hypothetical protein FCE95_14110 [Luteimonas gilva]|uniref:Uncharacterized protein n=1 Tax=Luteimonas gilva TaxID=2572684 RepID=A0A4V5ZPJ5_9GAMM|nr:hypothetical protein FCE95_14110 [Luteimonas gilva]